ncbi:MAG: carboxypeptidase-like regulatory domain-containing protein [Planctomycetota bacterium]
MKSFLVLALVAIAAGGLFFVLKGGDGPDSGETTPTVVQRSDGPAAEEPDAPAADLASVDDLAGRGEAEIQARPTVVEQDDLVEPVAAVGAGDLRGKVVDLKGNPVASAKVVLTRFGADAFFFGDIDRTKDVDSRTGTDGVFEFKNVPAFDAYSIIVTHPDHSRTEAPSIVVQDGLLTEATEIVMGYGVSVRGTVTDTGGNPVPAATLVLSQNAFVAQMTDGSDGMTVETDEAGRFEFKNVTPQQNYALQISAEGYGSITKTPIAVTEIEDAVEDIVLEVASMIAGVVTSTVDGTPLEGATIQAWSLSNVKSRSHTETKSNENGEFEIADITPGRYQIVARHPRHAPDTSKRVESGDMTVAIQLQPLPVITGQVIDLSTGGPVTRFDAQLRQTVPGSQDGLSTALVATRASFDDPNGNFEIVVPKAGEYMVEAIAGDFAETYSDPFQATMGQDVSGIVVRMTRGGVLVGRVLGDGGQPIAGAVVETHDKEWSDDPFWQSLGASAPGNATESSARTAKDGTFRLENLTPASYQIVVRHRDYAQETVKDVSVVEGQEVRVNDVKLPRGATISGTVLGPSGRPLAGAIVKLFPTTAGARPHTVQTNKSGEYTIRNVREGSYKAHATRPRTGSDNPFQENIDLKSTQRPLTIQNGQSLIGQDFKLTDR